MKLFLKNLLREIKDVSIPLYKILIPFLFIIKVLEVVGAVDLITKFFEPLMSIIGLPADLGIIWVTAIVVNIYAALILFVNIVPSLDVTVAQISVLTVAMLFCHNLAVESAISRMAGVSFIFTVLYRLSSAFITCFILNIIYLKFNFLDEKFVMSFTIDKPEPGLLPWLIEQIFNLIFIFIIIVVIVTILEIFKTIGVEKLLKKILAPSLKLFGISESAMNIIIVGMTLGLQFGGGILIKEVKSAKIDKQSVFLSILMINLVHAMIEDTLLMIAVGGHYSGVIFARIIFGFIISLIMVKIYRKNTLFFEKYIFNERLRSLPD